jgi:hypothetical protein
VAGHLLLVFVLYAWLTVERFNKAMSGQTRYKNLLLPGGDEGRAARVAANLNNQFQAPVLFHCLALALWLSGTVTVIELVLAWIFIGGRLIHTLIHAFSTNVVVRGLVFSINFTALCLMWLSFLWRAL